MMGPVPPDVIEWQLDRVTAASAPALMLARRTALNFRRRREVQLPDELVDETAVEALTSTGSGPRRRYSGCPSGNGAWSTSPTSATRARAPPRPSSASRAAPGSTRGG